MSKEERSIRGMNKAVQKLALLDKEQREKQLRELHIRNKGIQEVISNGYVTAPRIATPFSTGTEKPSDGDDNHKANSQHTANHQLAPTVTGPRTETGYGSLAQGGSSGSGGGGNDDYSERVRSIQARMKGEETIVMTIFPTEYPKVIIDDKAKRAIMEKLNDAYAARARETKKGTTSRYRPSSHNMECLH